MQHLLDQKSRGMGRPYVLATLLMGIPVIALLAVPLYAREDPVIWSFPMFYWWTFIWIIAISAGTLLSHLIIERSKADGSQNAAGTKTQNKTKNEVRP
jgi:hypothetical protein